MRTQPKLIDQEEAEQLLQKLKSAGLTGLCCWLIIFIYLSA
jgi:hypothetical protein